MGHIIRFFSESYGWIPTIMSVFILFLVEAVKIPVKKLTSRIRNDKLRALANKSFILLTFGFAFLFDFAASKIMPAYVKFDSLISVAVGGLSNLLYAVVEGLIDEPTAMSKAERLQKSLNSSTSTEDAITKAVDAVDPSKPEVKAEKPKVTVPKTKAVVYKDASHSDAVKNFERLIK